jgi:Putative phage serine protease XkdF
MPRQLKNAEITHVSYVDKAANQKKFFLTKSAGEPNFEKAVRVITKAADPKQIVYGVVYEPDTPDAHDDMMTAEEIEKAAHKFMKDFRGIDEQHDFEGGAGELLESYIAPVDMEVGGETIVKGSWVIVTKATDEIWEKIQKGEYTGYSMGGTAEVETENSTKPATSKKVSKQTSSSQSDSDKEEEEARGFFNMVKNFFTGDTRQNVTKGEVRDRHTERVRQNSFWAAWSVFEDVIRSYDWRTDCYKFEQDPEKVREALEDLNSILTEILAPEAEIDIEKALGSPPKHVVEVQKAGRKMSAALMDKLDTAITALTEMKDEVIDEKEDNEGDEIEMKLEDISKMLDDKLTPLNERLDKIEKGEGGSIEPEPQPKGGDSPSPPESNEDVLKRFGELLDEKIQPLEKRLTTIEKARNVSAQLEHDPEPLAQTVTTQKSYMKHFNK